MTIRAWLFALPALVACQLGTPTLLAAGQAKCFVLVVWDGMRPDFVSPELTPTLHALREGGVWFANHHSAFPTSTEVNGTVLATGVFPQRSGVTANEEYRPEIDALKPFGTESLEAIRRGDTLTGGKYLRVPTLAERVQQHGGHTAVAGAKPVALLHDRLARGDGAAGRVWFVEGSLPESLFQGLTSRFGAFPKSASPNSARDEWAARCLTEVFWAGELPRYSVLWLSEPDYSQHRHGPGSPEALAAIRNCDQRLATVLRELDRRGVRAQTDVMVVSDHGFSTIGADRDVAATLRAAGINAQANWTQPPKEGDVVVTGNGGSVMLYVTGRSREVMARVVATLQREPGTGVIFTRAGLPGTFPLAEAKIDAPTAADVIVASAWSMKPGADGHPLVEITNEGYSEYRPGNGMHVTLSPTDLHNTAAASGPDFRRGVTDTLPSGNVDVVPTFLWLMGIKLKEPLDGRVLSEALVKGGPAVKKAELGRRDAKVELADGVWEQYLKFTEFNGVRYLEEGNGRWQPSAQVSRTRAAKLSEPAH
jgi:arylsulfatase A-like enzyme